MSAQPHRYALHIAGAKRPLRLGAKRLRFAPMERKRKTRSSACYSIMIAYSPCNASFKQLGTQTSRKIFCSWFINLWLLACNFPRHIFAKKPDTPPPKFHVYYSLSNLARPAFAENIHQEAASSSNQNNTRKHVLCYRVWHGRFTSHGRLDPPSYCWMA